MVSHALLLSRLKYRFGITGSTLNWIKEYLENCSQSFIIEYLDTAGPKSDDKTLKQGIPQGSVLGPILFTLYICTFVGNTTLISIAMLMINKLISPSSHQ